MGFLKQATASSHTGHKPDDAEEPLLLRTGCQNQGFQANNSKAQKAPPAQAPVDLSWHFVLRLCRVLQAVNAAPALSLLVLSILEAVIVSKVGTISGMFYQVFVDGEQGNVPHLLLWSGGCYAATALFYTLKVSLQDFFAWRWRASLTCKLQQTYCSSLSFYTLKGIDNADQRLAQDLPLLTSTLAEVLSVLAAAPFNVIWYTRLTYQVFGSWCPVAAAYGFFLAGAVLQRAVMLPVARGVFHQEAAEGGFRYSHVRLRTAAPEIAIYRSVPLEHQHLTQQLALVLACQGRLLLRRAVLTSVTKVLEYGGLIVNFGCLAAAVFSGVWDSERADPGGIAAKVSVASFYLLTLIYSFTQVLDLASKVSSLAGLTARVSQLWEELQQQQTVACNGSKKHLAGQQQAARTSHELDYQQQHQQHYSTADCQQGPQALQLLCDHGAAFTHKRYASQAVMLQPPQLTIVAMATEAMGSLANQSTKLQQQQQQESSTGGLTTGSGTSSRGAAVHSSSSSAAVQQQQHNAAEHLMQVSIHSCGSDVLLQEVRRAFPDSPRLAPLTAVVTFQFCGQAQRIMMQHLQQQHQQHQEQSQGWLLGSAAGINGSSSCSHSHSSAISASSSSNAATSCVCSSDDMAHMLEVFLHWQQQVHCYITSRGYWCDAVDPRTGHALHGAAGCGFDEVIGAQVLLGYDRQQQQQQQKGGGCPLVSHPLAGTQVYPATLFTSAPLPTIRAALTAAAASSASRAFPAADKPLEPAISTTQHQTMAAAADPLPVPSLFGRDLPRSSSGSSSSGGAHAGRQACVIPAPGRVLAAAAADHGSCHIPLLVCQKLTVSTPVGALIVRDLTLNLTAQLQQPDDNRPAGIQPEAMSTPAVPGEVNETTSLLIQGPSGCGKSTLLKCFAGLWPADSGSFHIASSAGTPNRLQGSTPSEQSACGNQLAGYRATYDHWYSCIEISRPCVMFVPQRPLTAPGRTFRDQLTYPAAAGAFPCCCRSGSGDSCGVGGTEDAQGKAIDSKAQSSVDSRRSRRSNPTGDKTSGDCVLAVRQQLLPPPQQQQQVPHTAASSFWTDWLTCGILQQHKQLQQQHSYVCLPAAPVQTGAYRPCYSTGCETPHGCFTSIDTTDSKQRKGSWQQQQRQQLPSNFDRYAACPPCRCCELLLSVLQQVGLMYLLNSLPAGLDTAVDDWGSVLSPGELQRLAFARVLLHKPVLAVLDEATSSLPDDTSLELYHQLRQAHVNCISAAHSSSLEAIHDQVLALSGDGTGSWRCHAVAH